MIEKLNRQDQEAFFSINVYPKRGINIVRGKGAYVWDDQGRKYLDCVAGQGVTCLGHCHPRVTRAIVDQAKTLITCPNIFDNDVRAKALALLAEVTGYPKLFLCNSGAEALETAMKFARLLTGKTRIISMVKGFHGRTLGALSLTWNPKYRDAFQPLIPCVDHVVYNDIEAVSNAITDDTAAVVTEVIQGEGGVNLGDSDYFKALRALCSKQKVLLIADEVQTGFGRTGTFFAHQRIGIRSDMMAMAKGIANGVPMGAVAFEGNLADKIEVGSHGSTFGGNPLSCAASIATIEVLKEKRLPERADKLGNIAVEVLREKLKDIRLVKEVRGRGLMIGIELRQRATPILQQLMERGVLALPAGPTVLRLLPPLTISKKDLMCGIDVIVEVLKDIGRSD